MRGEASQVCLFDFHLHAQVCVDLCSFRWPVKVSQSLSATIRPPYIWNLCQAAMLNSVEWLGQQDKCRGMSCVTKKVCHSTPTPTNLCDIGGAMPRAQDRRAGPDTRLLQASLAAFTSSLGFAALQSRQAIGHLCLHLECDAAKVATVMGLSRVLGQAEHCSWTCRHSRVLRPPATHHSSPARPGGQRLQARLISWHDRPA